MNKTILGLDLGTNSIGWALVTQDFENKSPTEARLRKSSAYSLIVICLSSHNYNTKN